MKVTLTHPYRSTAALKTVGASKVEIGVGAHQTDVVNMDTGEVLFSTLSTMNVLSRTCRWVEKHHLNFGQVVFYQNQED